MTRTQVALRCAECGAGAPKWVGQCQACGTWGSIVESVATAGILGGTARPGEARPLAAIDPAPVGARPTGIDELDRVLGGGLVPGSVTLLGGEPGIGKSTLVLQALATMAAAGARCLLVSAEESAPQVRMRAGRLGAVPESLLVLDETSLPAVVATIALVRPAVCVVDSIQTVADPAVGSAAGSVTQVRDAAQALTRVAKETGAAVVLVGHVTKDGSLAGPRALEHVVDTVLSFEGDRHHALRILRAVKHRFGATGEIGLFEMTDSGMVPVADPSALFVGDRRTHQAGAAVVATVEGRRPLLVEIQALVGRRSGPQARRVAQGVDGGRVGLILAVLERRLGIHADGSDVYVSAAGGARLSEPAADLGIALALVSAAHGTPVRRGLVVAGEVGLGGDVRPVPHLARRLAEAARLGFEVGVVADPAPPTAGIELRGVLSLAQALDAAELPHADIPRGRDPWRGGRPGPSRPERHPGGGPCRH